MDKPQRITDPKRIRALAHPLRMELIDILGTEREATATRCAELTGESVASCSFHLRMLAKYGFVELAASRGRQKPWRLVARSRAVGPDYDDPTSVRASAELGLLEVEREAERLRDWIARVPDEPPEWVDASVVATSAFWATPAELKKVSEAIAELSRPFRKRWDNPSARPPDARLVRLLGATSVDPPPGATQEEE